MSAGSSCASLQDGNGDDRNGQEEIEYLAEHRRLVLEQLEEITAVYGGALSGECYVAAAAGAC